MKKKKDWFDQDALVQKITSYQQETNLIIKRQIATEIIESLTWLITFECRRYFNFSDYQDRLQIARLSIFQAIKVFDAKKSDRAILYIKLYIRAYQQHETDKLNLVKWSYDPKNPMQGQTVPLEDAYALCSKEHDPEYKMSMAQQLNKVINKLKPKQKELIKMMFIDGLSIKDISDKLGENVSGVHIRKQRVLKVLKSLLNQQELFESC